MKRILVPVIAIITTLSLTLHSCDVIEDFLSQGEAVEGLKQALLVGSDTAVAQGSAVNGYFANELIKIFLPPEAEPIITAINFIPGGDALLEEVVLKLNRAAEDAAPQATEIFIGAITNITFSDALSILNGPNDAATQYMKTATQDSINMLFYPHIQNSLQQVGAQTAWAELTGAYNSLPLVTPVNTDLAGYTTDRASSGLFELVALEEEKIREDPLHRVNEILESVFGD